MEYFKFERKAALDAMLGLNVFEAKWEELEEAIIEIR